MSDGTKPRVSIVIPTFRRAAQLVAAMRSAAEASSRPEETEIVVVDDASPDETTLVCQQLQTEMPNLRYWRSPVNRGEGASRNAGIELATGEYIAFLDDDDLRLPGSLDAQLARLDGDQEAAFCYAPVLFADAVLRLTGERFPEELPEGDIFLGFDAALFSSSFECGGAAFPAASPALVRFIAHRLRLVRLVATFRKGEGGSGAGTGGGLPAARSGFRADFV